MAKAKRPSLVESQRPASAARPRSLEELVRAVQGEQPPGPEDILRVPLTCLQRGRYQPRRLTLDNDPELAELADSIRVLGLIEPLAVRPDQETPGNYEILAGDRRWRAAQLAGLSEVPVIVHRVDDQTAAAMALVENLQRQDLNPLEEAGAMQRLLDEFGLSQADLGRLLGKSRSAISRTLGLLALATPVQALLQSGRLEAGHARVLLNLDEATQVRLARLAADQGWSVRELETRKAALLAVPRPQPSKPVVRDPDVKRLEQQLGVWLAAPVSLRTHRHGGGAILIRFSSTEECSGILERIGFSTLLDD